MMTKRENQQIEMHLITIEDLVPMDHLLRKVNDIIDFSFISPQGNRLKIAKISWCFFCL